MVSEKAHETRPTQLLQRAAQIALPEKTDQRDPQIHDQQPHERTKHDDHTDHDNTRPPNRPQKMATHHPQRQRPGPPGPRLPRMRLLAPGRNLHPPRPRQQNLPPPPMPPLRETNDNVGNGKWISWEICRAPRTRLAGHGKMATIAAVSGHAIWPTHAGE